MRELERFLEMEDRQCVVCAYRGTKKNPCLIHDALFEKAAGGGQIRFMHAPIVNLVDDGNCKSFEVKRKKGKK